MDRKRQLHRKFVDYYSRSFGFDRTSYRLVILLSPLIGQAMVLTRKPIKSGPTNNEPDYPSFTSRVLSPGAPREVDCLT